MGFGDNGSPLAGTARSVLIWLVAFGLAIAVLVAVAVNGPVSLPWIVAAICLSVLVFDRTRAGRTPASSDLDLFLERCRRRGEETTFVVVDIPSSPKALPNLLQSLRITDSLVVQRSGSGCEVHGLLDGPDTVRAEVENRFAGALGGITPTFGWASYPADGLTVDALYGKARGAITAAAQSERAPAVWWRPSTTDPALEGTFEASPKGA